jgi:hypothetical protein
MAEVGELEPWFNPRTKRQEYRLVLPKQCRDGHALRYPNIHLTHRGCQCAGRQGHTVVICRTCSAEQLLPACLNEA